MGKVILVLLLLLPLSMALQVSPAAKKVELQDAIQYAVSVVNDGARPVNVTLSPAEPFSVSVQSSPNVLHLEPSARGSFVVTATFEDLPKGRTNAPLYITTTGSSDQFGGLVTLQHTLSVLNPYAGSLLEGTVHTAPDGITIILENLGDASTQARVVAFIDSNTMDLGNVTIGGLQTGKVAGSWGEISRGAHNLSIEALYVDSGTPQRMLLNLTTQVGKPLITTQLEQQSFPSGQILRVPLSAELDWNIPINVSFAANMSGIVQRLPTIELVPGKSQHEVFIDARPLQPGNHSLRLSSEFGVSNFEIILTESSVGGDTIIKEDSTTIVAFTVFGLLMVLLVLTWLIWRE